MLTAGTTSVLHVCSDDLPLGTLLQLGSKSSKSTHRVVHVTTNALTIALVEYPLEPEMKPVHRNDRAYLKRKKGRNV